MKKILLLAAFVAVALNANAWIYNSSCGKVCQTVSPDFFKDNPAEGEAYYKELDKLMCNPDKDDDQDHPAPDDSDDANP